MRHKEPFTIFPRKTKNGKAVLYFRTYNEDGNRTTARSTGQTNKAAARTYVTELLKSGNILPKKNPKFKDYIENWWRWDECPYVLGKRARGKNKISRTYVESCRSYLDRHILPYLGNYRISAIKTRAIEGWLLDLRNKHSRLKTPLSPTTINQILMTLKIIFKEGVRIGDFSFDPTATVLPLEENREVKSFLNPDEIKKLFNEKKIQETWGGDLKHYTLNLLAASSGMRLGECQGLQNQYVQGGYIDVRFVWIRKYGLKEWPKKGSKRKIPIPSKTQAHLSELIALSPYQEADDLIFWGVSGKKPMDNKIISTALYDAFCKIGVSEEQRKERNVTFHSWRYFYNSFLRGKVADVKLQHLTGHRTQEMTDHYTSFRIEDFEDVIRIQENFFNR
ncbi:MAG: site-specific integrase [Planctomycetes bacterium]|nr:site-specific integrase [Planctomycetota bacterium]